MEDFKKAPELVKSLIHRYYGGRNDTDVLNHYAKDMVSWIGIGDHLYADTYGKLGNLFRAELQKGRRCEISGEAYQLAAYGADYCVVTGCFTLWIPVEDGTHIQQEQRVTSVLAVRDGVLKIVHQHMSVPLAVMSAGEITDESVNHMNCDSLVNILKEKTEQIEMMTRITAGGVKGSLDDDQLTFFYVNNELCEMLGYTYEEFMEMSRGTALGAVYPPDLPGVLKDLRGCRGEGEEYKTEYRMRKKDGSLLWVLDSGRKTKNLRGETVINSIVTDISEMKQTLNQLQIEKERNDIVAELSDDIIFEYDFNLDTLEVFHTDPVTGKRIRSQKEHVLQKIGLEGIGIHPDDLPAIEKKIQQLYQYPCTKRTITAEFRKVEQEHGAMVYCWRRAHVRCICDMEGRPVKAVGKLVDIGAEKQLLKRSTLDYLTGLFNRACLEQEIMEYIRVLPGKVSAAFILLDIDYFKKLNDTCGHLKGDETLRILSELLRSSCRATDMVGRLGGDEFVILLKDVYDTKIVIERVEYLQQSVKMCVEKKKISFPVTLSIGITIISDRNKDFKEMYHEADVALYQAKRGGRNQYVVYKT